MATARDRLQRDPRVATVETDSDGIWVMLRDGWRWSQDAHCVHEDTWGEVLQQMKLVQRCDCRECENRERR